MALRIGLEGFSYKHVQRIANAAISKNKKIISL
jgi:hypothetical protein